MASAPPPPVPAESVSHGGARIESSSPAATPAWLDGLQEAIGHGRIGLRGDERTEFHFRLDSPEMEPIHVRLESSRSGLMVNLTVGNGQVLHALEAHLSELRQRLGAVVVTVNSFGITREGDAFPNPRRQTPDPWVGEASENQAGRQSTARRQPKRTLGVVGRIDVTA